MSLGSPLLAALLKPLVRFFLRRGVRLQELSEVLKASYVGVAKAELLRSGEEANISRVSVMTGVHRKDVQRLFDGDRELKSSSNLIARVLNLWQHDSRFTAKGGEPRFLSYEGKENDFIELVSAVSNDLNPYTVLFELERSGLVEKTDRGLRLFGKLRLSEEGDEGFVMLAADEDDLFRAVEENIVAHSPTKNLHLKTEFDNIDPAKLEEVRKWFLREGSAFHERARALLAEGSTRVLPAAASPPPAGARQRPGSWAFGPNR